MRRLSNLWEIWKGFARVVGDLIGRVLLTIFYFLVFAPVAIGVRILSDPLRLKVQERVDWSTRTKTDDSFEQSERLF